MRKAVVVHKLPSDYRFATDDEEKFLNAGEHLHDHIWVLDDEGFDYLAVPLSLPVDMFPEYDDWRYPPAQSGADYMAAMYNSDSYISYLNG